MLARPARNTALAFCLAYLGNSLGGSYLAYLVHFPLLVLLSLFLETRLTFVLPTVYIAALFLMAISVWQTTQDGEAAAFEGLALVGFYVILAVLTFYE